jgi:hypothetical protein
MVATQNRGLETDLNRWAAEKYDHISKAAFDTYETMEIKKTIETADSFHDGVMSIMKQAGVPEDFMAKVSGTNVGTEEWLDAFHDAAVDIGDWATDTAVAGFLGYIGLGAYIPAAENVVSKVRSTWREHVEEAQESRVGMLSAGQWVYINNGRAPMPGWHDELRRRLISVEQPKDKISLGFYIGVANKAGFVQVFNFELFREQRQAIDDVVPCGPERVKELDNNTVMSAIRDLKVFRDDSAPAQMDSLVPTDPGTEVIFGEKLYHIVKCEGGQALIEDEHGAWLNVSLDKLTRGRVKHTNSWNYREGEPFLSGFQADGAAKVYSGQWVWVTARQEFIEKGVTSHELAVVWKIQRDGVYVFQAIDGTQAITDKVWPLADDLSDALNLKKNFLHFRQAAVEGGDTPGQSVGKTDLLLCIGRTNEAGGKGPTALTPGEQVIPSKPITLGMVGDGGVRDEHDMIQEISRSAGIPPGDVERAVLRDTDDDNAIVGTAAGGDSLFGYGVMAAVALLLWNSVDVNFNILGALS